MRTEAVGLGPAELWGSNVRGQLGGREVLAETVGCWAEEDEQCLKKEKIWEEEQLPEHMTRRTQSDLSERGSKRPGGQGGRRVAGPSDPLRESPAEA